MLRNIFKLALIALAGISAEFILLRFILAQIFESRIPGYVMITAGVGILGTMAIIYYTAIFIIKEEKSK